MFKESGSSSKSPSELDPNDVPRKLYARDIALGIGRTATDMELEEYLSRPHGNSIRLQKAVSQIKN